MGREDPFHCITFSTRPIGEILATARPPAKSLMRSPARSRARSNLALVTGRACATRAARRHHRRARSLVTSALGLPSVRAEERTLHEEADEILDRLELASLADRPASGLPYGTLKRIELARALCQRPRLLLLDEPASGLTSGEVDELRELIGRLRDDLDLTVLLVEHHMAMVMRACESSVLDFWRKIAEGPPLRSSDPR